MELPADLEAMIRGSPDDRESYLVAGDWLQQHGDPQGELIALGLAGDRDPRIAELEAALDPVDDSTTWRHVFCDWRWGFVRRIQLWCVQDPDEVPQLRAVLDAPAARFARELVIEGISTDEPLAALVALAAARPECFACLQSFVLRSDRDGRPMRVRSLAALWNVMPRLERLVLAVPHLTSPQAFPALRELVAAGSERRLVAILDTHWPKLETLRLIVDGAAEPLIRWLTRARFPALRRLGITVTSRARIEPALWQACGEALGVERLELAGFERKRMFAIDDRTGLGKRGLLAIGGRSLPPGLLVPLDDVTGLSIGRAADSDLVLDAPVVGLQHAILRVGPPGWMIVDQGASLGVVVNGVKVSEVLLRSGDELDLAGEVLRFVEGERYAEEVTELCTRFAIARRG